MITYFIISSLIHHCMFHIWGENIATRLFICLNDVNLTTNKYSPPYSRCHHFPSLKQQQEKKTKLNRHGRKLSQKKLQLQSQHDWNHTSEREIWKILIVLATKENCRCSSEALGGNLLCTKYKNITFGFPRLFSA